MVYDLCLVLCKLLPQISSSINIYNFQPHILDHGSILIFILKIELFLKSVKPFSGEKPAGLQHDQTSEGGIGGSSLIHLLLAITAILSV